MYYKRNTMYCIYVINRRSRYHNEHIYHNNLNEDTDHHHCIHIVVYMYTMHTTHIFTHILIMSSRSKPNGDF